jgi:hemerythrin-like domain-containing protein
MTDPTEMLEEEHRFIAKVVGVAPVLADRVEAGQAVEAGMLREIVEFMRTYADKFHHGKEEDLLFPALIEKGVPVHGCPIGALTAEHVTGRALVKGLAEATDVLDNDVSSAREDVVKNLRGIAELYPNHIWKEDYLLFPMTHKVMRPEELQGLYQAFQEVEESMGKDTHHRLEQWAEQLEQRI